MTPPTPVLFFQATVEYVGVTSQGVVQTLQGVGRTVVDFVATPRGVLLVVAVVVLLSMTVGRRRRL